MPYSRETNARAFDIGRELAGRSDIAAEPYLRDAARHDVQHRPLALLLLASLLSNHGRFAEAARFARQGLAIAPQMVALHNTLALALLARGDYEAGWREYEWRRHLPSFPALAGQEWRGERVRGVLLVRAEQGMGDSLMLARYLPMAAARVGSIVLGCQTPLISLLRSVRGVAAAVTADSHPRNDRAIFMGSLPHLLGTRLSSIPSPAGYLAADPVRVQVWSSLLPGRRRIGLVWAGNPGLAGDEHRSIAFDRLAPLLATPHAQFFSLQVGERAGDIAGRTDIVDLSDHLTDFAETAAVIANLDLVIAVDTAVAHLAGALGRSTWILLPRVPDWRWLTRRTDSPWYASVRLFRQARPDDWDPVIRRVATALRRLSAP